MKVAEIFGFGINNHTQQAKAARKEKYCPFRDSKCTKSNKKDPLGICSLSDGQMVASLCPVRFLENDIIFRNVGKLAFGEDCRIAVFPEVRILTLKSDNSTKVDKKIGKVDFLIGLLSEDKIIDFAALEVQAAYFSGSGMRPLFEHFIETGNFGDHNYARRPDFRSSAQKRLIPQLSLKVPVFRRWGKKFFVAVDSQFFNSLPKFPITTEANSELTWLSYPIQRINDDYKMQEPNIIYSEWDDVQNSLREGMPPEPSEIISELQSKLANKKTGCLTIISI